MNNPSLRLALLCIFLLALIILPFVLYGEYLEAVVADALATAEGPLIAALLVVGSLAVDVLLPLPSSVISAAATVWLGPWVGGMAVWLGMTTGHAVGYFLGWRLGTPAVAKVGGTRAANMLAARAESLGLQSLLAMTRAVPVLAEAVTVVCGAAGMGVLRFLLVAGLANAGVAGVYAGAAVLAGVEAGFVTVFIASLAVPACAYLLWRVLDGKPFG